MFDPSSIDSPTAASRRDMESQPSEQELVESFLRPRVVSGDKSCKFIHEANVYAADPANLTRKFAPAVASNGDEAWYFFSTVRAMKGGRRARTVDDGEGCWHSEAGAKPVVGGSGRRRLGHRQIFSFVTKDDGGQRIRSGWLMVELGLDGDGKKDEELVLSKVYFSSRAPSAKKLAATSSPHMRKMDATDASPPARQRCRAIRASPDEASAPEALSEEEDPMADEPEAQEDDGVGGRGIVSWWLCNRRYLLGEAYNEQCPAPEILPVLLDTGAYAFDLLTWMQNQPDVPATYGGGDNDEAHSEKYCPAPEVLPDTGACAFDLLTWMQNQPDVPATYGGGDDDEAHSQKYCPAPEVLPDTGACAFDLLTWMQNQPDVPATYGDGSDEAVAHSEKYCPAPEVLPDTGGALDLFVPFTRFTSFTSFPSSPSPVVESDCSSYEPSLGRLHMPEIKEFLRRAPPPPPPPPQQQQQQQQQPPPCSSALPSGDQQKAGI
ncbi:hypothetical protein ABZP36_025766 [Zizania latifolia]